MQEKIEQLNLLPKGERLEAIKVKDEQGNTMLHSALFYPKFLKDILETLPERDRWDAIKMNDETLQTVLHLGALYKLESLKAILETLPESEHLNALMVENAHGTTVLHEVAIFRLESFANIFKLLPESDRLKALKKKNTRGKTLLDLVIDHPESLTTILETFPESDRLDVIKVKDEQGNTVLHSVVPRYPQSLKAILETLPKGERLKALKEKNTLGNTVLHDAVELSICKDNPDSRSLSVILELYPGSKHITHMEKKKIYVFFEALSSYEKIYRSCKNREPLEQAKALLRDYTKNNSRLARFFTGHVNRHHVQDVNRIIHVTNSIEDLLNSLKFIVVNPNGSLARRISYIESQNIIPSHSPKGVNDQYLAGPEPAF